MPGNERQIPDKSGRKPQTATDIYRHILDRYSHKLVRLDSVATVQQGITTCANAFFYLTSDRIAEFRIEPEYCQPVMTTPAESGSIAVKPTHLPKRLFVCNEDKELAGPGALAYIRWGETRKYDTQSGTRDRQRWYDLGKLEPTQLAMNKRVDTTARTFLATDGALFSDHFQVISITSTISPTRLCAAMNSTLFQLMLNAENEINSRRKVLIIQANEAANLQIVNPELLPEPKASIFNATDWDALNPSAARRHIDEAMFDILNLTTDEQDAVYEGVWNLVQNRIPKEPGSTAGTDKSPFEAVPLIDGFAPGVNSDNLKEILYEMDISDYLEKERTIREQHE